MSSGLTVKKYHWSTILYVGHVGGDNSHCFYKVQGDCSEPELAASKLPGTGGVRRGRTVCLRPGGASRPARDRVGFGGVLAGIISVVGAFVLDRLRSRKS